MIGFFDSGVGGLTVLRDVHKQLPEYATLYLGDSARAPYGTKSHEQITQYTWQGVEWLFSKGCPLVILACNSASAQALRTIQQQYMGKYPGKKVLGVIRPTAETLATQGYKRIAVFSTPATKQSGSYTREFYNQKKDIEVVSFAFPRWVPLVESGKHSGLRANKIVKDDLKAIADDLLEVDAVLLACTHYPVLFDLIRKHLPHRIDLYEQGPLVASSLADYLKRHTEIEEKLKKSNTRRYFVTGDTESAEAVLEKMIGEKIAWQQVDLGSDSR